MESNGQKPAAHVPKRYQKVLDGRKQPIRGLTVLDGRFYGRLLVEDPATGVKIQRRVRLIDSQTGRPTETVAAAKAALEALKTQRRENRLPILQQTPTFREYSTRYLDRIKLTKRGATVSKEGVAIRRWCEVIGGTRLDKISKAQVMRFRDLRLAGNQSDGKAPSPRTVNLDIIVLRNVLKRAQDDGFVRELPTAGVRALKISTVKRDLYSSEQIEELCSQSLLVSKNGLQFSDYVRLLCWCGARRDEALRLRWADVDFEKKTLVIGADGLAKNHGWRVVDFSPKLEELLRDMHKRRAPDSEWLFPSPQRGKKDVAAKTFKETLWAARKAASLPKFGFHDCRHYFISHAVMAGVNFMTIAKWVGHKDGGILIGKVYGHLTDEHAKSQAQKLKF